MPAYSGLFNGVHGENYALLDDRQPLESVVNKLFRRSRYGMRELRELLLTTVGATAGATASDTYQRVPAVATLTNYSASGGLINPETVTVINRATTAADVTRLQTFISRGSAPSPYPVDLSGNGGGKPTAALG